MTKLTKFSQTPCIFWKNEVKYMMGNVGLLLSPAAKFKKYFNNLMKNYEIIRKKKISR